MKTLVLLALVLIMIFACCHAYAESGVTAFYVSTDGSDSGSGTYSSPFATLAKAVSASRVVTGDKRIFIRGGEYKISSTVNLNSSDKNLKIMNYNGESVRFSTSRSIPYSAFTRVTDTGVLSRIIESSGRASVMQVHLPSVGITDYGQLATQGFSASGSGFAPTLTFNDKLLDYAGYPNKMSLDNGGYIYTSSIQNGNQFTCDNQRYLKYKSAEDMWILGFFTHDWAELTSSAYFSGDYVVLKSSSNYGLTTNRRVRFFNLLEELDAPGEFYLNRNTGYLYIIPPMGIKSTNELRFTSGSTRMLNISSTSNITIKGIHFEGTRGNAVNISGSNGIVIDGCEFSSIGDSAVMISSSYNCGVSNSNLHDLGSWGVYFNSCGDRKTLTNSGCFVTNCRIERFSQYKRTYAPGVFLSGCGFLINHNYFGDSPHFAIRYDCNEAVMEYNEYDNICNDSSDAGAIYTGRDWSMWGNIIRYNYFHDMKMITTTAGMKMQAVYLDDMHASTKVYKNVFYKCDSVALFGGGRNCTFENNMMLECKQPFVFDARGTWGGQWGGNSNKANLLRMPYTTGIWAQKYPELVNILDDDPLLPKHNVVRNNVHYRTPEMSIDNYVKQYSTVEKNIYLGDTVYFKDYANKDFRMSDDKRLNKILPDFEDIPCDEIGTYDVPAVDKVSGINNVSVDGTGIISQPLTAKCTYWGNLPKGDIVCQWYVKRGTGYQKINGADSLTFVPDKSYDGMKVRALLVSVNSEGYEGGTALTDDIRIYRQLASQTVTATRNGNQINFTNNGVNPVSISVASAVYTSENGYKKLENISLSNVLVAASASVSTGDGTVLVFDSENLEPIKTGE